MPGPADAPPPVVPFRLPAWACWGAAIVLALATGYLAQLHFAGQAELVVLRESATLARVESESARQLLEAERLLAQRQIADLRAAEARVAELQRQGGLGQLKIAALAAPAGGSSDARAVAVWSSAAQQGVLAVEKLPILAADQDYQLWIVDAQSPTPVDGGVFAVDPATGSARFEFRPKQPVAEAARFAVSRERKGGAPKAEGPAMLLGP